MELSRKEIIEKSLEAYGYILVASHMDEAIEAANEIASEHLEILTRNPFETMTKIKNAGAIFLGEYSSEPLGDYYAGPNHILDHNFNSTLSLWHTHFAELTELWMEGREKGTEPVCAGMRVFIACVCAQG